MDALPVSYSMASATMRTVIVIFILALLAIAGEVYSDALLRSGEVSHAAPDPVTMAVAHGVRHW